MISGMKCVNVPAGMKRRSKDAARHLVYLVDDNRRDADAVTSDSLCGIQVRNLDPRLFGAREWPLQDNYFASLHSCLKAL